MKKYVFFLLAMVLSTTLYAQHITKIRNLWTRPQVHVFFEGYRVSFAIRDINKALALLRQTGDSTQISVCKLDTAGDYNYGLMPGTHTEYRDAMEPFLQDLIGPFLLTAGRAVVERGKNKFLKEIIVDVQSTGIGGETVFVEFFDPANKKRIFSGMMPRVLYGMDLGIDD